MQAQKQDMPSPNIYAQAVRHGGVANDIDIETVSQAYARKRKSRSHLENVMRKGDAEMILFLSGLFCREDMLHRMYADKFAKQR